MKATILCILVFALSAAVLLHRESSRLLRQETALLAVRVSAAAPDTAAPELSAATAPLPSKMERPEKPVLDLEAYLERYREVFSDGKMPGHDETDTIKLELGTASPRDLANLPALMEKSGLEEHTGLYQNVSTRLLDHDPELATEFALKGRDIRCFNFVIRQWISRDPKAAGEWLAMKSQCDPPLNADTLRTYPGHPDPLDMQRLQLAAGIAAAPGGEEVSVLMKLDGSKLTKALQTVTEVLPPAGLPALLKRLSESGRTDLIVATLKHYPEPSLAREHLEGSDLPPDQFLKAATTVVAGLDPVDMGRGVAWYFRHTDPAARGDGIKEIVTEWTHENPRSAKAWLDQLPPGSDQQAAADAYAEALRHPRKSPVEDPF